MELLIGLLIGIVTGCIGWTAIPLSRYIYNMESEVCKTCERKGDCFAMEKLPLLHTNNLNQWMMITYFKVKKRCKYIENVKSSSVVLYVVANCALSCLAFWSKGGGSIGLLYAVVSAALLYLSVVDWHTQYIPLEMSGVIFVCGLIQLFADFSNWFEYVIGLIAVSGFLLLVDWIGTRILAKRYEGEDISSVIGDGDIKLMAATGLLLGWKLNFLALGVGCISGSVIHLIRMKIKGSGGVLALGPYLSLGIYIIMICGEQLISWYLNMLGVTPY